MSLAREAKTLRRGDPRDVAMKLAQLSAKVAATSGYIVEAQGGGTESDVLRNKPAVVPKKLHGDKPAVVSSGNRSQKTAGYITREELARYGALGRKTDKKKESLAKSAASSTEEFGYGRYPGPEHQSRRTGENKPTQGKKTPDMALAEMAYFESLTGQRHPKRLRRDAKVKKARRLASSNSNSFSRGVSPENVIGGGSGKGGGMS